MCTIVIGDIHSTLAFFVDKIKKEEAALLKAYIQQAIANFVASVSVPTLPQIPSHSQPTIHNGSGMGKDKNIGRKVDNAITLNFMSTAINSGNFQETLKLPIIPELSEKKWDTVACSGQNKALISLCTIEQENLVENII